MKKLVAIIICALMLLGVVPASAQVHTTAARTEKLDLTTVTSATSNESEGWAYDPAGRDGQPLLTLTNYGSESAHSAPILVPENTTVVVNGDNYLDNACMGEDCDVLSGCYDGFLRIEGSGTLNLYALSYQGRGISVPTGGVIDDLEHLIIYDTTINIYSQQPQSNTAYYIKEGIYANQGFECHNATINITNGTKGIWMQGMLANPEGGMNENNCPEVLIDNSEINIDMSMADGVNLWNYATAIYVVCGRVRITGGSNVNIKSGTKSIYASYSLTIESGTLNIDATPPGGGNNNAVIYVNNLVIGSAAQSVYIKSTRFTGSVVLYCKTSGISSLGSGLEMAVGTFEDGNFTSALDPDNNGGMPALKIVRSASGSTHTVNFYGFDGTLIESVEVEDGQAATAPEVPETVQNENGLNRFYAWDADFSNVTEDMDVHAEYVLMGDVDFNGRANATDALLVLRYSMGVFDFTDKQIFAGDFNLSGDVTATDALMILRYAMVN